MEQTPLSTPRTLDTLVALSPAMHSVLSGVRKLARGNEPVFVDGQSGTGRKLLARVIHEESTRVDKPFAIINCDRLTVDVLDRVLFGDAGGMPGKFEEAAEGTLLLADIEDLNPVAQERICAVLERGTYTDCLGTTRPVSCRILATGDNKEISKRSRLGQYSSELFRRLTTTRIQMPSLVERREDIPHLVIEILQEFSARERIDAPQVPYHYMELLTNVAWPENVRQLRNHVESVMVLSGGEFNPQIIRDHFVPETSPATIKGAVQSLWNRLRGAAPISALNANNA